MSACAHTHGVASSGTQTRVCGTVFLYRFLPCSAHHIPRKKSPHPPTNHFLVAHWVSRHQVYSPGFVGHIHGAALSVCARMTDDKPTLGPISRALLSPFIIGSKGEGDGPPPHPTHPLARSPSLAVPLSRNRCRCALLILYATSSSSVNMCFVGFLRCPPPPPPPINEQLKQQQQQQQEQQQQEPQLMPCLTFTAQRCFGELCA